MVPKAGTSCLSVRTNTVNSVVISLVQLTRVAAGFRGGLKYVLLYLPETGACRGSAGAVSSLGPGTAQPSPGSFTEAPFFRTLLLPSPSRTKPSHFCHLTSALLFFWPPLPLSPSLLPPLSLPPLALTRRKERKSCVKVEGELLDFPKAPSVTGREIYSRFHCSFTLRLEVKDCVSSIFCWTNKHHTYNMQ